MEKLRIKNIRSIKDSGYIDLKPITVAIGKNSCGKSTFIRTFPLLKQSLEKEISESLLWYGDYVDFGNFTTIKNFGLSDEEVTLEFVFHTNIRMYFSEFEKLKVNLKIVLAEKNIKEYQIEYLDQKINIVLQEHGKVERICINDIDECIDCKDYSWIREPGHLLPIIYTGKKNRYYYMWRYSFQSEKAFNNIVNALMSISNKRTNIETIRNFVQNMFGYYSKAKLKEKLSTNNRLKNVSKYFSECSEDDVVFMKVNTNIVLESLTALIYAINITMSNECDSMHYLKPIRANANRYYRVKGVNTNQVDSDGSNLPMILYNLNEIELSNFEAWTKEKFGITFSIVKDSGHISLIIKNNGVCTNLADTGYGYSQILPIILQLWLLSKEKKIIKETNIFVIEQPELHLHPAFQAKIIDAFANIVVSAQKANIDLKIIFETHSETMINRLGYLIYKNKLPKEFVNVLIFNKINEITNIQSRTFDENGIINGWPIGFFSVED